MNRLAMESSDKEKTLLEAMTKIDKTRGENFQLLDQLSTAEEYRARAEGINIDLQSVR